MKGLTFHGKETLKYETVADPTIENAQDVIVKVDLAGICGSDLHPYCGREKGLDVGTVVGHEMVGTVVETGESVSSLRSGDRVVAPFSTNCGDCFYCRKELTSRCEVGQLFGWRQGGAGLHGCQAELVRVPEAESSLVSLSEALDSDLAVLAADILPTSLFAADLGRIGSGSIVAVVGCGPVGLLSVVTSRMRGARRVLAIDRIAERLDLAAEFGGVPIGGEPEEVVEFVLRETDGRGADAVLEVVGSPAAARLAVALVRPGGTIATVGFHTVPSFAFSPGEAYDKNLTYRTGRCPARRFIGEALEILGSEGDLLSRLITHRLPLAEGPRAYEMFNDKRESCIKVVLKP